MTTSARGSSLRQWPGTQLGWWAGGIGAAYVVLYLINTFVFMPGAMSGGDAGWRQTYLPYYGILMVLCGLLAGGLGLAAVVREHERSWLVWLSVLIGASVVVLLLGEFLVPH